MLQSVRLSSLMLCGVVSLASYGGRQPPSQLKVTPQPGQVIPGVFNITDMNAAYDGITVKSDGQRPAIAFTFFDWNRDGFSTDYPALQDFHDPLPGSEVSPLELAGRMADQQAVLAVAWDAVGYLYEHPDYATGNATRPIEFDDIFSGVYDDYIRTVARQIREFGEPIMLSPTAEFNSVGIYAFGEYGRDFIPQTFSAETTIHYGDPTLPDGPERVRDLYRHVIDIFNEENVNNVTWFMYSHTNYMNPAEVNPDEFESWDAMHPEFYYPGDDYMDWIGTSAYVSADDPTIDLEYAIQDAIDAFREFTDKPFFAAEFGVTTESDASRADRMATLFASEIPNIPELAAFAMADDILFEEYFTLPRLGNYQDELEVWYDEVVRNPYYAGTVGFEQIPSEWLPQEELLGIAVPEPSTLRLALGMVVLLASIRRVRSEGR